MKTNARPIARLPAHGHEPGLGSALPGPAHERLETLGRAAGPLRRAAVAVAARMAAQRGWERLGFARVGDYARERLGQSGRTMLEWARVGRRIESLPRLEAALTDGSLSWSKVRLLARFVTAEDEARWIEHARTRSVRALERELRAVDRGTLANAPRGSPAAPSSGARPEAAAEALASDEDGYALETRERVALRVSPRTAFAWADACRVASQAAGQRIPREVVLELITAEMLSALPGSLCRLASADEDRDGAAESRRMADAEAEAEAQTQAEADENDAATPPREPGGSVAPAVDHPLDEGDPTRSDSTVKPAAPPPLPAFLAPLVKGLEDADAFALDARLCRVVRLTQVLDAEIAPLLRRLGTRPSGASTRAVALDRIARERLGISPRKARALVRIERLGDDCPALRRAFRDGSLSWVQAQVLAPLLERDAPGPWRSDWIDFAGRVTVRRLEDVVAQALAGGGLDPEALDAALDRVGDTSEQVDAPTERSAVHGLPEAGAARPVASGSSGAAGAAGVIWKTCARPTRSDETIRICVHAPADVARLFRATLCTVRKLIEVARGRLPVEDEAFAAMIEHALATWQAEDPSLRRDRRRRRVFERDGWQCTAPGCSARRNLQAHHVVFRSAGGDDTLENQTTLCAFHHHRGVHAGRVSIHGRAPDRLEFALGLRAGAAPLARYRSGDRLARADPGSPARHPTRRTGPVL